MDFDNCGYDAESMVLDTRNTKYQARVNHTATADAGKSFNVQNYAKIMKKREQKEEREAKRVLESQMLRQVVADNKMWAPVDDEDARHMKREAQKRQQENEKASKKMEKRKLQEDEEYKEGSTKQEQV